MKTFLCAVIAALFCSFFTSQAATYNVAGTLSSNTVWTTSGDVYVVTGNLTVSNGVTLTVGSGVVVKFQSATGLYVNGTLNASSATFTSSQASPQKGDWNYIQIGNGVYSGIANFTSCTIQYGGTSSVGSGMLYVYQGTAALTSSTVELSKGAGFIIGTVGATVRLSSCTVQSSDWVLYYNAAGSLILNGANVFTANNHNAISISFSTLSTAWALPSTTLPIVFTNGNYDFNVAIGAVLTIPPGNILKFTSGVSLVVDGGLAAIGTNSQSIIFTAYTDDNAGGDSNNDGSATAPAWNYWGAVKFTKNSTSASCVMRYCTVRFGGSGSVGGISMYNSSPTIEFCTMTNNYYGAMMYQASYPTFTTNTIASSQITPIAMSFESDPIFDNNTFSFSDNQYDAIGIITGTVTTNANLKIRTVTNVTNITYIMLGTVTVPVNTSLTVQPGVVVKFRNYYDRIVVQGKMVANATTSATMIVFTSVKDDSFGNPMDTNKDGSITAPAVGDWSGIVFEGTTDPASILNFCRVKYAAMSSTYYNTRYIYDGAITLVNATATVANCEISNVKIGIFAFQASNPQIFNNAFINTQYTPVAVSCNANPQNLNVGNTFVNVGWAAIGIIGETLGVNSTIPQRTMANLSNISYVLLYDLTINSGAYLTINPGVVIKFSSNTGIFVNGGFLAKGTIAQGNVVFTSLKDDNYGVPHDTEGNGAGTYPAAGDWKTIQFLSTSDDSFCKLDSCIIKFGGNGNTTMGKGLVSYVDAACPITNTILSDSYYYGLYIDGASTPSVSSATIQNCHSDPIAMSLKSDPFFDNYSIIFSANASQGLGIIEGTLSSNALLHKRNVAGISNIAYIIHNLTVAPGVVFTVQPGVVIKLSSPYDYIDIQGALVANGYGSGDRNEKIIFTSIKDDSDGGDTNNDGTISSPSRGDWFAIDFFASSLDTLNSMKYCEIRYAGSGYYYSGYYKNYGAVRLTDCFATIQNCTIELSNNSGIGIYGSANPNISYTQINNVNQTPIAMSMFSTPYFGLGNTVQNAGYLALGIVPETYSVNSTVPVRNFAGYNNITYLIFGSCTVNSGTNIVVPRGLVFKSNIYGDVFIVNGGLSIGNLTPDIAGISPFVVFTDTRDDTYGNPPDTESNGAGTTPSIGGYGSFMNFSDISNDAFSVISNTIFRYKQNAIYLTSAAPTIRHCIFNKDNWGVYLDGASTPKIDTCSFDNLSWCPMIISLVSYPISTSGNIVSGSTYKAIGVKGETLTQDVTLIKRSFAGTPNMPYFFTSNYTIGTSARLIFSAGLVAKFSPGVSLTVRRTLQAIGDVAPDQTIVFTDIRDDFFAGDSNSDSTITVPNVWNYNPYYGIRWAGIIFENESLDATCQMSNCIIRYAEQGITCNNSSPTILNSAILLNNYGVEATGASNPLINYCDVYQNFTKGVDNPGSFTIDARYNWWGNNSGPTNASNVGGTGDVVSNYVNFSPYGSTNATLPLVGDVSLNGYIQAYDATQILLYTVAATTFTVTQQRVADVSWDGTISAYDASLVLQYVAGISQSFPAETSAIIMPAHNGNASMMAFSSQPVNFVVGKAKTAAGTQVSIPLSLRNVFAMNNLSAVHTVVAYNDQLLRVISVKTSGSGTNMMLAYRNDNGKVSISLAGINSLADDDEVAVITFEVAQAASLGSIIPLAVNNFIANETDASNASESGEIEITDALSVADGDSNLTEFLTNYPNPFSGQTTISYRIITPNSPVSLEIYNTCGQLVKTLVQETENAGSYQVLWNGNDNFGNPVQSGVFFCRMNVGGTQKMMKITVQK